MVSSRPLPQYQKNVSWRSLVRVSLDFPESDFEPVLATCKQWIGETYRKCFGKPIASTVLAADENDYRPPGHCFAWVTINAPVDGVFTLFSAKVEHPDQLAARTWSVELEVARTTDKVVFGLRMAVFGTDTGTAPQSIPRLAKHLVERGARHGNIPLSMSGSVISSPDDLVKLAEFVNNADRVIPLIVISEQPEGEGWPADIQYIAEQTKGTAIAVAFSNEMTYRWRDLMPPKLNVFGGASRIYMPLNRGFLFAPILLQKDERHDSDEVVDAWAIRNALQSSVNSPAWIDRHSNFEMALAIKARLQRREAIETSRSSRDTESLAAMYEEEIEALTTELKQEREESRVWAGEVQQLQDQREELESTVRSLRYQISTFAVRPPSELEYQLNTASFPATLADIRAWYENSTFTDRLFIAPRALRECEKSAYDSPQYVYSALTILANEFHNSRQPGAGLTESRALELALNSAKLRKDFAGSNLTLKNQDYQLEYEGRWLTTDWHLTKGGGRESRFCMRIYYCWDTQTNKCVVGWMPSHLDNSLT